MQPIRDRLTVCWEALGRSLDRLELEQAWKLATAPLDPDHPVDRDVLAHVALELTGRTGAVRRLLAHPQAARHMSLTDAEQAARCAQAVRYAASAFPQIQPCESQAVRLEQAAAERALACLAGASRAADIGRCSSCGGPCAPWFTKCESCHGRRS